MDIDLKKLEAVALEATPGPWERSSGRFDVIAPEETNTGQDHYHVADTVGHDYDRRRRNADFIAAADPTMLLKLVAWIRALEAERNALIIEKNNALMRAIKAENPPVTGALRPQVDLFRVKPISSAETDLLRAAFTKSGGERPGGMVLVHQTPVKVLCPCCFMVFDPTAHPAPDMPNDPLDDVLPRGPQVTQTVTRYPLGLNLPESLDLPDSEGGACD